MKKTLIIIAVVVALIVAFSISAVNIPWLYIFYRIYPFDRLTGEYDITVNGEELNAELTKYYEYDGDRNKLKGRPGKFSIKGNDYAVYKIGFIVSDEDFYKATNDSRFIDYGDVDLSVNYLKTNRWMVCDFDIDIDLIEENGEWYVCYDIEYYAYLDEFPSRDDVKFEYSKIVKLSDIEKENFPFGV